MPVKLNRRRLETLLAASVAVVAAIVGIAIREETTLGAKYVALDPLARLENPVFLAQPPGPGSDLYVVQKAGAVRIIAGDHLLRRPFLDIRHLVESHGARGEPGMASIAFPPDYERSGLLYVAYTDRGGALVIASYRRSADDARLADPGSGREILRITEPTPAHHGGLLAFGPGDHLYVATGDGGPAGDPGGAQSTELLLGKVLRIDPTATGYSVPPDNPFVRGAGRDEIWALGLRNPRGISFDRVTKTIAIADAGQDRFEEVNFLPLAESRGANLGWPAFEAFAPHLGGVPRSEVVPPTIAYRHRPGCAVAGGFVLRDPHLARIAGREIYGDYVFGDYCTGRIFGFRPKAATRGVGKQRSFNFGTRYLIALGQGNDRRAYVLTERGPPQGGRPGPGAVYRLVPRRKHLEG
jgi:glucose/arabinose dehydrogenase